MVRGLCVKGYFVEGLKVGSGRRSANGSRSPVQPAV
jgi:hypothetical protein